MSGDLENKNLALHELPIAQMSCNKADLEHKLTLNRIVIRTHLCSVCFTPSLQHYFVDIYDDDAITGIVTLYNSLPTFTFKMSDLLSCNIGPLLDSSLISWPCLCFTVVYTLYKYYISLSILADPGVEVMLWSGMWNVMHVIPHLLLTLVGWYIRYQ